MRHRNVSILHRGHEHVARRGVRVAGRKEITENAPCCSCDLCERVGRLIGSREGTLQATYFLSAL